MGKWFHLRIRPNAALRDRDRLERVLAEILQWIKVDWSKFGQSFRLNQILFRSTASDLFRSRWWQGVTRDHFEPPQDCLPVSSREDLKGEAKVKARHRKIYL